MFLLLGNPEGKRKESTLTGSGGGGGKGERMYINDVVSPGSAARRKGGCINVTRASVEEKDRKLYRSYSIGGERSLWCSNGTEGEGRHSLVACFSGKKDCSPPKRKQGKKRRKEN